MVLQDDNKKGTGFDIFFSVLQPKVAAFCSPVLMVHGDTHMFRADKPFKTRAKHKPIRNFTGVEVFGPREIHGVRIVVDTGDSVRFKVAPLIVKVRWSRKIGQFAKVYSTG